MQDFTIPIKNPPCELKNPMVFYGVYVEYIRFIPTTKLTKASLFCVGGKSGWKSSFHCSPGEAENASHTLAVSSTNGLLWVGVYITGLTKILLLYVQSQNPAPRDI